MLGRLDGRRSCSSRFCPAAGCYSHPLSPSRSLRRRRAQFKCPIRTIPTENDGSPISLRPTPPAFVPEPILTDAPHIEQMIKDGKLRISLQDAVDLALQNNLSIVIQRYQPWIMEANVLRTLSGSAPISGQVGPLGTIPALTFDPLVTGTFSLDNKDSGE